MPQIEHKAAYGLELQSNSFEPREGALEIAENIVISQDNIFTKKRGQKLFVDPTPTTIKKTTSFNDKLLGISDGSATNKIEVYNQNADGSYLSTSGLTNETGLTWTATAQIPREAESNGNMYIATDAAVIKLESTTGSVLRAGIDEATDLRVFRTVFSGQETYLTPGSQVGYRALFGRKDANKNTIIGAPSEFTIITNTLTSGAAFTLPGAPAKRVRVAAASTPFVGAAAANFVYISESSVTGISEGVYQLDAYVANTSFDFISDETPSGVGTVSWGGFYNAKLEFDLPDQVQTTEYFTQIYRTTASAAVDIEPDESTLQLVDEFNVAAGDITKGFITYYDITPDTLRGAFLYTNPNTGEPRGIAEANVKPPQCEDMEIFKDHMFFSAPTSPYRLTLNLVTSTTTTMPNPSEFTIQTTAGANIRTYRGVSGTSVGNRVVQATNPVGVAGATVTITYTGHGFFNGDIISVIEAVDSSETQIAVLTPGSYTVSGVAANTFNITTSGTSAVPASLSFAGLSTSTSKRYFYISQSDSTDDAASVASAIDETARNIVRAINRDSSGDVIAFYTSTPTGVPGQMTLQTKTTTTNVKVNAVTATIVDSFVPSIATSGSLVLGTRESESGALFIAKQGKPEAVPIANKIVVGSKTAETLRIKALKDSLIVIKKDGIFRINGSDINSFSATILDSTVTCKASDSVAVLNNQVWFLSEQGYVAVSETSVAIKSRQIEPLLTAIVGKPDDDGNSLVERLCHAVGYESERLYICTAVDPNYNAADDPDDDAPNRVYVFNELTNAWTTWTNTFDSCFNNPKDDRLYYLNMNNEILREKKNQDLLDFSDDEFPVTVLTAPSTTTVTLSVVGGTAQVGDVFVIDEVLYRIVAQSGDVYTLSVETELAGGETGTLYRGITSVIRLAPLTGGDTSVWKQFSEFKATFRNNVACTRMDTYFLTDDTVVTETTEWEAEASASTGGWGELPWGQFPWGLEGGTSAIYETSAAQAMRLYIPLDGQRGTFIQAHMVHSNSAENIALQSIAYTARIYGQRTTK